MRDKNKRNMDIKWSTHGEGWTEQNTTMLCMQKNIFESDSLTENEC